MLQKAQNAKNTSVEAEGLERIQLAVMESHDKKGINMTSLAKNLSAIDGLTDINGNAIKEDTEIVLPENIKLNNYKYSIKEDGTVERFIPKEFQEVKYIESSGTQFIDTRLLSYKDYDKVEMDLSINQHANYNQIIIGSTGSENCSFVCVRSTSQNSVFSFAYNDKSTGIPVLSSATSATNTKYSLKFELSPNYQTLYLDNTQIASKDVTAIATLKSVYIFAGHNADEVVTANSLIKLYKLKIYKNNSLIRDYIPCYSTKTVNDADGRERPKNTIGLYDKVNGQFYVNKGSGIFGYESEDGIRVAPQ